MGEYNVIGPDGKPFTFWADDDNAAKGVLDRLRQQQQDSRTRDYLLPPSSGPIPTPSQAIPPTPPAPEEDKAPQGETKLGDRSSPLPADTPLPGVRQMPTTTTPSGEIRVTPHPPPDMPSVQDSLTGPRLPQPTQYHTIIPYPGARPVRSRMTQEQWDRHVLVRRLARRMADRTGREVGALDVIGNSMFLNLMPQIRGGMETFNEGLHRFLRGPRNLESDIPLSEAYGLYRDAHRSELDAYARENPVTDLGLNLLGGLAGARPSLPTGVGGAGGRAMTTTAPVSAPPVPPPSTSRALGQASAWGAGTGAVSGAADRPESWSDQGTGAVHGALGGAVLGPAAYLGLRGAGAAVDSLRRARRTPLGTPSPQERAAIWDELGVEPPNTALFTGPVRQASDYLTRTPFGMGLQQDTATGLARLQQSLSDTLRFSGAGLDESAAGAEAQRIIRRALGAGKTPEEIARMSADEVRALSGIDPMVPGSPAAPTPQTPPRTQPFRVPPDLASELSRLETMVQEAQQKLNQASASMRPYLHRPLEEPFLSLRTAHTRAEQELAQATKAREQMQEIINDLQVTWDRTQHLSLMEQVNAVRQKAMESARRVYTRNNPDAPPLPPSRETFATQLAAGERAVAGLTPPAKTRLLGARTVDPNAVPMEQTRTALVNELDQIARDARSALRLPGYKPTQLFSYPNETLFPGLQRYFSEEMGTRAGSRVWTLLERLAAQRRLPSVQGLQGTGRILQTLVALRGSRGMTAEGENILNRIIRAIENDVERVASQTPDGKHWLTQKKVLEEARQRVETEYREPLTAVTGTTNTAQALSLLQQAMRPGGNVRTLRAFLQIAAEKGDRSSAVGLLLTNMGKEGPEGFLRNWRAMTPEARAAMFVGPTESLGARLERFAQAVEQVAGTPTTVRLRDLGRARTLMQGLLAWLHWPTAVTSVLGHVGTDRLLASAAFRRWLLRAPLEAGPLSQAWRSYLSYLGPRELVGTGIADDTGREIVSNLQSLLSSAMAETRDPMVAGKRGQEEKKSEPEATSVSELPPWHRARTRAAEMGSIFADDLVDLTPDQSIMAGPPRRTSRPGAGPTMPSLADMLSTSLRPYVPSTVIDRAVHPLVSLSPAEGAFQGGRALARGWQENNVGSMIEGTLSTLLSMPSLPSMGIVIGLPGARALARAGEGNAQRVLLMAELMHKNGRPFNEIQEVVGRRLTELGDREFGNVVLLPSGQIGLEMRSGAQRIGEMRPYEVRTLAEVRQDPGPLYRAHPEVGETRLWHLPELKEQHNIYGLADETGVTLHQSPNTPMGARTLEHETQHLVSHRQGFPPGGTIEDFRPGGRYAHMLPDGWTPEQGYYWLQDEWLARQAMERMGMSAMELREEVLSPPPYLLVQGRKPGSSVRTSAMAGPRRGIAERDQMILRMFDEGKSLDEIVQALGITRPQFRSLIFQRAKVVNRPRFDEVYEEFVRPRMTREVRGRVLEDARAGMTVQELMTKYDYSEGTIKRVLRSEDRNRLLLSDKQKSLMERDKEILRLFRQENGNMYRVARALDVEPSTLRSYVRDRARGRFGEALREIFDPVTGRIRRGAGGE